MNLAKNEELIKVWNYAVYKEDDGDEPAKLALTNKRLIWEKSGKRNKQRKEVPIKDISCVSFKERIGSNAGGIVTLILGLIMLGVGVYLALSMIYLVAVAVVGLILFIVGICMLGKGAVDMEVYLNGVHTKAIDIGASNVGLNKGTSKTKLVFNKEEVADLIENFGAKLLEAQTWEGNGTAEESEEEYDDAPVI